MSKILTKKRARAHLKNKTLLKISGVTKKFPGQNYNIVDNVSLSIDEGDLFVLVGPSGCGKTTLLRMIAGFEQPNSGTIMLDKKNITDLPPYERPINMMFQSYALFPHMSVAENVAFGLKQQGGISKGEIKTRVEEALTMVNMQDFALRNPNKLSGGQKQRVALARSLVKRPKLLLLDEPLGALDRKTRENTAVELIKIQYMLDITFIMVTHDQDEAMTMADKMAVMKDGHVLQIGTPEDIYEFPNSRFVAEFVNSINIFKGFVVKPKNKKGFVGIKVEECEDIIMARARDDLSLGQIVWLGIRPEEVEIDINPAPKNENQVVGKIIDYGFLGHQIVYHVELSNKRNMHVSVPTAERMKNPKLTPGRKVYISWYHSDGVILTK